jgi:hypothetical protein
MFWAYINPLPLLFKALLQGQKDHVFFSGHLIYMLQQECFRAGVFNVWPAEPFAVARRPFWKNNYKR